MVASALGRTQPQLPTRYSKAHTGFEPVLPQSTVGKPDSGSRASWLPVAS
jgi:hypothetical protein